MNCGLPSFLLFCCFGVEKRGQKRPFLGGRKSPILARGHMGKTAVFNQIVLYLETPNLAQKRPFGAKLTPYKKMGPPLGPPLVKNPAAPTIPRHFVFLTRSGAKLTPLATRPNNCDKFTIIGMDTAN